MTRAAIICDSALRFGPPLEHQILAPSHSLCDCSPMAHIDWTECALIETVPGKRGGKPVIKGTRLTPEDLLTNREQGVDWRSDLGRGLLLVMRSKLKTREQNDADTVIESVNASILASMQTASSRPAKAAVQGVTQSKNE